MNGNVHSKYCVIKFMELPFKGIDDYVCIPSSWVRLRIEADRRAIVSYPVENTQKTEKRVKQRQRLSEEWRIYMAVVKYETDFYDDAQIFINEQLDSLHCVNETSNFKKGDHELLRKDTQEPKRADNSNHKMEAKEFPQEFVVLKNDGPITKIKLKRVKNITSFGSKEPSESDSEVQASSRQAPEGSNENQFLPTHTDYLIKNACTQEIPVERSTNNTPTEKSSNLANPSLDLATIARNNFFTGFLKFLRDLPPPLRDIEKLRTAFNKNPEKTKKLLKSVIKCQTPGSNITTASTLKETTAEVTKTCGRKRNAAMELDDVDGNEGKILKKKRHNKLILPPEYDENDSRWTLKYRTSAQGLVELMPNTGVYINAVTLSQCKKLAQDCNTLARVLFLAILKTSAMKICSLIGTRAKACDLFGENIRPGLDANASKVILEFVKQYGSTKGWNTSNTKSMLKSIRNKMLDIRRKHN